jgi:hypothetical protein
VRHKHNLKMSRLSWARVPNKVEWPVATELWLATVWSLDRADHSHPSKHALYGFSQPTKTHLAVVSDVPVDDETPLVTSGISRSVGVQSFRGAHRGRVCVRVFIGVSVRACCEHLRCTVSFSKKNSSK